MSKIILDDVGSGYQTAAKQNANNDTIETHLNDKVLYRDNPSGEANTMQQELDMNSNQIRNVTSPNNANDAATKGYADSLLSGTTDTGSAQLRVDLADTANGEGASLVGIEDSAGGFTATTVEGALVELESEKASLVGVETLTNKTITNMTVDLAIADGGTGASTAAAAFTALKQAASVSATGVVEIATQAEVDAGSDATRILTPETLAGYTPETPSGFIGGVETHIENDTGAVATSFDVAVGLTINTWESIGPSGSIADNIWVGMDDIPVNAKTVILKIYNRILGNTNGDSYKGYLWARKTGSITGQTVVTQIALDTFTNRSGVSQEGSSMNLAYVPLDSSLRFDLRYSSTGTSPTSDITIMVVGWVG